MSERFLEHDWFSHPLPENVKLGHRTWLYSSFAFAHYQSRAEVGLHVGDDTGLYHGTFFDLGPLGEVQIGDYCSLVGVIIATNGRVSIGNYTLIAHEVVIAGNDYWAPQKKGLTDAPSCATGRTHKVIIGENVWIGARAILLGNVRIGDDAIIGAAAVVTGDVPPNAVYAGNPGRVVGEVPRPS